MTKAGLVSDRTVVSAETLPRRTLETSEKAGTSADSNDESSFPMLLSKMTAGGEESSSTVEPDTEAGHTTRWPLSGTVGVSLLVGDHKSLSPEETALLLGAVGDNAETRAPTSGPRDGTLSAALADNGLARSRDFEGIARRLQMNASGSPPILSSRESNPLLERIMSAQTNSPFHAASTGPNGDDGAIGIAANVTVLRQETHFAPVQLTVVEQIAERIAAGMRRADDGQPAGKMSASSHSLPQLDDGAHASSVMAELPVPRPVVQPLHEPTRARSPAETPFIGTGIAPRSGSAADGEQFADIMNDLEPQTGAGSKNSASFSGSPLQQTAARVAAEAATPESAAGRTEQRSFAAFVSSAPSVKVLHIQLHPADLGSVVVRMTLKKDALDIQLEVARHETANLLQKDRDALRNLLRSAGYLVDGMTVQVTERESSGSPGTSQSAAHSSMQAQSDGSQKNAGPFGGQAHAGHESNSFRTGHNDNDADRDPSRIGGDLYV